MRAIENILQSGRGNHFMSRLLILVVVVLVAIWAFQRAVAKRHQTPPASGTPGTPHAGDGASQNIVPCAHCGVHLPAPDAIEADGHFYCCQAHARIGRDHEA